MTGLNESCLLSVRASAQRTVEPDEAIMHASMVAIDALTSRDDITLHGVSWQVDEDNPAWSLVRADAIRGALIKGQDYANALGGRVERVQHVADAGLLGGEAVSTLHGQATARALRGATRRTSLNPEPQVLTAVIDARLITSVGALPQRPAD